MDSAIISVRGLGKRYFLQGPGQQTFREALLNGVRAPLQLLTGRRRSSKGEFWALRDLNFDIQPGEAVGIIGRNGAGKSTLLKILSRIVAPTTGEARLGGRVASLLEVGTGFHAELSGRENIFLNGAIMGMSRAEVRARFDEIVAFAEVEQFLDVPVKRYSSGMYVRLAFAVAAHLRPEILIVDEVLAVGDASFQKKCLGKMHDVTSGGRTVLFVSHNMAAITRLCRRAILLRQGGVVADGPIAQVAGMYSSGTQELMGSDGSQTKASRGSEHAQLLAARIVSNEGNSTSIDIRQPFTIEMDFEVLKSRYPVQPNISFWNEEGMCVFATTDSYLKEYQSPRAPGRYRSILSIPGNLLAEGTFAIDVALTTLDPFLVHALERGLFTICVFDPIEGDSVRGVYAGAMPGVVRPMLPWRTVPLGSTEVFSARAKA